MTKNFKITIEYDGTDFVGWQYQKNGRSVQEAIGDAINIITREKISLVGAGRTDSGVHARGQVANFHSSTDMNTDEVYRSLNGLLPEDVAINKVEIVEDTFSARFSAIEREYRYFISRAPSAIDRKYSWQVGYVMDVPMMNKLSETILGIHDFQSFCKAESNTEHFLCNISLASWTEVDGKLIFTIRANRFLHGMVRALVGTFVNIGRGFTKEREFVSIMESKNRSKAGQAAPSLGLFLEKVTY